MSVTGVTSAPTTSTADGTTFSTGTDRTAMDTNTFLKLLVAQLKYQDPSNPTDSSQFLAQTAQFTAVEKTTQLTDLTQKVLDAQNSQTATSLLGKTVSYTDASGAARTGLVTGCTLGASSPNLTVDGLQILLTSVTGVTTAASPTASTTG
jgi:flagellar basal-body rod modification protein FlgD